MERFEGYGFSAVNMAFINGIFKDSTLSKIHMDVFTIDDYMLLSRNVEKNVTSKIDDGRAVLIKRDKTVMVDILLSNIKDCMVKKHSDVLYEFVFKVHNVCYKSLVAVQI